MKIQEKESTIVKPTEATPNTSLWISNLDVMLPNNCHVFTVYFYRSNGAANFFDYTVLKKALGRAMVQFYPVAGRLKMVEDRIEINCNGEGASFVEVEFDGLMDDLGDFVPRPDLNFAPTVDYSKGISSYPLFLVQVTRFKCGGVCVGVAIEHHLSDGISAVHFMNTWCDIARGLDVSIPPFFDRTVLCARNPPRPMFSHAEYLPPPTTKNPQDINVAPETTFSMFKLTRDQLNALKAKCSAEDDGDVKYSTFDVLVGHAWRCVSMARRLPKDQETRLLIVADGRSRLQPSLPPGYFGNAIFRAYPGASVGELESNPVKFAAHKIREAISRMDNDYLRSSLDYLELQPDIGSVPRGSQITKCPNFGISSWVKLPLYEADFGWGRPIYVGPSGIPREGITFILPSPAKDGSLLYAISLPKEQICLFEKLLYDI